MVAPVTDLGSSTLSNTDDLYRWARRYRQAKPIDRPLPYETYVGAHKAQVAGLKSWSLPCWSAATSGYDLPPGNTVADLQNRLHDKMMNAIQGGAQLGASLAEFRQSLGMVNARVLQIATFARKLRKFDFNGAAHTLALPRAPKGVSKRKSMAGNWLEYSFGIKPLVGDIYSAIDVLQNPIKSIKTKVGAVASVFNEFGSPASDPFSNRREFIGTVRCRSGCEVMIENHNLYLASRLGLINPATVVWEIIPFSFVVDWFINVEQFLSSGTDFVGLSITNAWNTTARMGVLKTYTCNPYWDSPINIRAFNLAYVNRGLGLVRPQLIVRPWKLPGWGRVANAAALLTVLLSR